MARLYSHLLGIKLFEYITYSYVEDLINVFCEFFNIHFAIFYFFFMVSFFLIIGIELRVNGC